MNDNDIQGYLDSLYVKAGLDKIISNYVYDLIMYGEVDKAKYNNEVEKSLKAYFEKTSK